MSNLRKDYKREQCYGAERHFVYRTLLNERQSFDSLVAQTQEIEGTDAWRKAYGLDRPLTIEYNTTSTGQDFANRFKISYHVSGSNRAAVVHEMAHCLTPMDEGHGHSWRSAYIWLMRLAYGSEWADGLAAAFHSSKLSYDIWPCDSGPVFPPALFDATHGGPLFTPTNNPARGPIAL